MSLIRVQPDRERARSLIGLARLRYGKIESFDLEKESSLVAESYYEAAKELIVAIMFIDGYKALMHFEFIEYIKENYGAEFTQEDIELLDQLRRIRNKLDYYGVMVESSYIKRNKGRISLLIDRLFLLCERKLG